MSARVVVLLLCLINNPISEAIIRQHLGGAWKVTNNKNNDELITLNATVPGGIFTDAMNNGLIGDIFYGKGDSEYRWIGENNWTYSTTFNVNSEYLGQKVLNLVLEGVDTFATIVVNGAEVGKTENMFVRYVFDVKEQLKAGSNHLEVAFTSAVAKAAALATDKVPPNCPPNYFNGICDVNRIRKMQASFAWDWGPAFASLGLWKDVYLEGYNDASIDYLVVTPLKNPDRDVWTLLITTYFNPSAGLVLGTLTADLRTDNHTISESYPVEQSINEYGEILLTGAMEVPSSTISQWWPNGYGFQTLYKLRVTFVAKTTNQNQQLVTKTARFGFRTIELVQDQLEKGLSFYFKVNGVPIFAKGSNEIPISILPEKGTEPKMVRTLLGAAKDTNMNMLRVWGGGVYESDYFYDLADEYGILIWQDFMFACALYPAYDGFLSNVKAEVQHQVKRLGTHPSIAIFGGNNENEVAMSGGWWGVRSSRDFDRYKADYIKLYVDTIGAEVKRILPHSVYLTSSPSNGQKTIDEGYIATRPSDSLYGDVHVYDYRRNSWSIDTFPTPRFSSEYGYQSHPSLESYLTATTSLQDILPSSSFTTYRQHHNGGETETLNLIAQQMKLPAESSRNYGTAVIYLSQILQAQAIKVQTEHYRSFKGRVNSRGEGYTMGALFWQLNDVWVAPTWSSIDFTGRWKMLHYFARDFFSSGLITGHANSSDYLNVYAVYDGRDIASPSVEAKLVVYNWKSLKPVLSTTYPVTLDVAKAVPVVETKIDGLIKDSQCGDSQELRKNCFFYLELGESISKNYIFLSELKSSNLIGASVQIASVTAIDKHNFEISVKTDAIALFVWVDSHDVRGVFSENGFLLVQSEKVVRFTTEEEQMEEDLQKILTVTHLHEASSN